MCAHHEVEAHNSEVITGEPHPITTCHYATISSCHHTPTSSTHHAIIPPPHHAMLLCHHHHQPDWFPARAAHHTTPCHHATMPPTTMPSCPPPPHRTDFRHAPPTWKDQKKKLKLSVLSVSPNISLMWPHRPTRTASVSSPPASQRAGGSGAEGPGGLCTCDCINSRQPTKHTTQHHMHEEYENRTTHAHRIRKLYYMCMKNTKTVLHMHTQYKKCTTYA